MDRIRAHGERLQQKRLLLEKMNRRAQIQAQLACDYLRYSIGSESPDWFLSEAKKYAARNEHFRHVHAWAIDWLLSEGGPRRAQPK
jgi:hypothetical protein